MYSMKECCKMTGLSYDTLKYYCNEGLIPNVKRDKNSNYRVFDDDDINWIKSLQCLKKCNFSLKEIRKYIDLCLKGKESIPERKEMLLNHRQEIEKEILSLEDTLKFIDKKNALYDKFLSGEVEYFSYLLKKINRFGVIMENKVLIATNNEAKVALYSEVLKEIGLEAVSPKQLGVKVEVEENGVDEIENAVVKAKAFYNATGLPVIANDSGLYIDKFSKEDQPNLLVRRFGGKERTDEEMIEMYTSKLKAVGGESTGHYNVGLAVIDKNGNLFTKEFKPSRFFVSVPSEKRIKGFPLSSIAFDKKTNKYLSEMTTAEKIEYEADVMVAQKQFIHEHLS